MYDNNLHSLAALVGDGVVSGENLGQEPVVAQQLMGLSDRVLFGKHFLG
jgi:hypothetical protein